MTKKLFFYPIIVFFVLSISSCISNKNLVYFSNIGKDSASVINNLPQLAKISKNDVLQLSISSLDEQVNRVFSSSAVISAASTGSGNPTAGILVDESGNIKLPLLGTIKAEGLTKEELANKISNIIETKKLAIDPVVSVRITSYKVTVIGEVLKPGVIPVPSERITIPEALGLAGDLGPYAKRNTILLIRETGGQRIYKRFSLNDSELFSKDFYYLQDKDVLYVEPNNAKAGSTDRTTQLLPILISSLSLLTVLVSQVLRR